MARAQAWLMVQPYGRILMDTREFLSEADVWRIVLGWPDATEIEQAKRDGYRVVWATVTIEVEERVMLDENQSGPGRFTLHEQITCAERELALRRSAYPGWVKRGRMGQDKADQEIACMEQIVRTLRALIAT